MRHFCREACRIVLKYIVRDIRWDGFFVQRVGLVATFALTFFPGVDAVWAANAAPQASLSLHSVDENGTICLPASALGNDPDGDALSVSLVEGFTQVGQERLDAHLSMQPVETVFAPGEEIMLDAGESRDKLGQRVTWTWSQVFMTTDETVLSIEVTDVEGKPVEKSITSPYARIVAPEVACNTKFIVRLTVDDGANRTVKEVAFDVRPKKEAEDCVVVGHSIPSGIAFPGMYETCLAAHETTSQLFRFVAESSSRQLRKSMFLMARYLVQLRKDCAEIALKNRRAPQAEKLIALSQQGLSLAARRIKQLEGIADSATVLLLPRLSSHNILAFNTVGEAATFTHSDDLIFVQGEVNESPAGLADGVLVIGEYSPEPDHDGAQETLKPVVHSFFPVCLVKGPQTVKSGQMVTLSASDSYDLNDETLRFEWTLIDGIDVPAVSLCAQVDCQFEAPITRDGVTLRFRVRARNETSKKWSDPTYFEVNVDGTLVGEPRVVEAYAFTAGMSGWKNEVNRKPAEIEGNHLLYDEAEWDPLAGTVTIPWQSKNEYQGIYRDFDLTGKVHPDLPVGLRVRARAEVFYEGDFAEKWAKRQPALIVEIRDLSDVKTTQQQRGRARGRLTTTAAKKIYSHTVVLTNDDWDNLPDHRIELGPLLQSYGITKFRVALIRQSFVNNLWYQNLEIDEVRLETQDESNWDPAPIAAVSTTGALPLFDLGGRVVPYRTETEGGVCITPPKNYSGSDLSYLRVSDPQGAEAITVASIDVVNTHDDPPVVLCPIAPIVVSGGDDVALSAAASYDPEGEPLRHEWHVDQGDGTLRQVDAERLTSSQAVLAAEAVFPAPYVKNTQTFTFRHQVTEVLPDSPGQSAQCIATVIVRPLPDNADHRVCPTEVDADFDPTDVNLHYDLADALKAARNGDVIEFCADTTHIIGGLGKAWTIAKEVILRGEARKTTILRGYSEDAPVLKVRSGNVRIEGLQIENGSIGIHVMEGRLLSKGYWDEYLTATANDGGGHDFGTKRKWVTRYVYEWFDNIGIYNNDIYNVHTGFVIDGRHSHERYGGQKSGTKNVRFKRNQVRADVVGIKSNEGVDGVLDIADNEFVGHEKYAIFIRTKAMRGKRRCIKYKRGFRKWRCVAYQYTSGVPVTKARVRDNFFLDNESAIHTSITSRVKYRRGADVFTKDCNRSCYPGNSFAENVSHNAPFLAGESFAIESGTQRVPCYAGGPALCVPTQVQASRNGLADDTGFGASVAMSGDVSYVLLQGDADEVGIWPRKGWLWCNGIRVDWRPARLLEELGMREWNCLYQPDPGATGSDKFHVGAVIGDSAMTKQWVHVYLTPETPSQPVVTEVVSDEELKVGQPTVDAFQVFDPEGDHQLHAAFSKGKGPKYGRATIRNWFLTYTPFASFVKDCAELSVYDSDGAGYTREICFTESGAILQPEVALDRDDVNWDDVTSSAPAIAAVNQPAPRGYNLGDGSVELNATSLHVRNDSGGYARSEVNVGWVVGQQAYVGPGIGTLAQGIEMTSREDATYQAISIQPGIYDASEVVFGSGSRVYCEEGAVLKGPVQIRGKDIAFYRCKFVGDVDLGGFVVREYVAKQIEKQVSYVCRYYKGREFRCKKPVLYDRIYTEHVPESQDVRFVNCEIEGGVGQKGADTVDLDAASRVRDEKQSKLPHSRNPSPQPIQLFATAVRDEVSVFAKQEYESVPEETAMPEPAWIVSMEAYAGVGIHTLAGAMSQVTSGSGGKSIYIGPGTFNGIEYVDYQGNVLPIYVPSSAIVECAPSTILQGLHLRGDKITVRGCHVVGDVIIEGNHVTLDGCYIEGSIDLGGSNERRYVRTERGTKWVMSQQYPVTTGVTLQKHLGRGRDSSGSSCVYG